MTAIRTQPETIEPPGVYPVGLARYGLAGLGIGCVGVGAAGVVLPGLPTTIFLIIATWCFARSFPSLTERLIHNRFFGPFLRYVRPGAVMPLRAKIIAGAMMWAAIALSCWFIARSDAPPWVPVTVVAAGVVGTWCIARQGVRSTRGAGSTARSLSHPVGRTVRAHKNPACTNTTAAFSKTL